MTSRDVHVLVKADLRPFVEAMNRLSKTLSRFHVSAGRIRRVDRHHPRPLPIDGHEYRRRQRSRRRR